MLNRQSILLVMLAALLGMATAARAELPGITNPDNWKLEEVTWANRGGVPYDAQFNTGLTACYNLGYGATVLGVTMRVPDDNRYYAAVVSCVDARLTVQDYVGPISAAPTWDSGPYHVAAGLPDGRLLLWLTAPGEYPVPLTISWDYIPLTAFDCRVYPPSPASNRWEEWSATVAYISNPDIPGLEVVTVNGLGRFQSTIESLRTARPQDVVMREFTLGEYILPFVFYHNTDGTYSAWYHPTWGWQTEKLADYSLGQVRLWLTPPLRQPAGFILCIDSKDIYEEPLLNRLDFTITPATGISVRWGDHVRLDEDYHYDKTAFIDSVQYTLPVLAQDNGIDVFVATPRPPRTPQDPAMVYNSTLLHRGERRIAGSEEIAEYPVVSIAGTAHWSAGTPEIYWVQLGGGRFTGEGALFCLSYPAR